MHPEREDILRSYGWTDGLAEAARTLGTENLEPARVLETRRGAWTVLAAGASGPQELEASAAGRLLHESAAQADLPATGDWVLARRTDPGSAVIQAVLPRRSKFSRKRPGDTDHDRIDEQVIAANVDYAFIVGAAGKDWNPRRAERYLTLAWESGAQPVLVITKSDLAEDLEALLAQAAEAAPGAPVVAVCAREGRGLEGLDPFLVPGRTAVLLGSSGTGKSTLLNALAGSELQKVQDVRADDHRGRHTTTTRTLFRLPSGALVIDTPGLREIQLWADADTVDSSFADIEARAESCRFRDCSHEGEPGCAVRAAVEAGDLAAERLESWRKLRREVEYLERRGDPVAAAAARAVWRSRAKAVRALEKARR